MVTIFYGEMKKRSRMKAKQSFSRKSLLTSLCTVYMFEIDVDSSELARRLETHNLIFQRNKTSKVGFDCLLLHYVIVCSTLSQALSKMHTTLIKNLIYKRKFVGAKEGLKTPSVKNFKLRHSGLTNCFH